jgi:hypothetical protein
LSTLDWLFNYSNYSTKKSLKDETFVIIRNS